MKHKIIIDGKELAVALPILKQVISKSNVLPILEDILLSWDGSKATLTTTDLDTSVIFTLNFAECASAEVWGICIPATDMAAIKSKDLIILECDTETFVTQVTTGHFTSRITGENADDFPRIPALDTDHCEFLMTGDDPSPFVKAITFAGTDDFRPALTGVYLEVEPGKKGTIVATDAHRLYQHDASDANINDRTSTLAVIIAKKTIKAMSKMNLFAISVSKELREQVEKYYPEGDDFREEVKTRTVNVPFYANVFIDGKVEAIKQSFDVKVIGHLIDAQFPDFRDVVPTDNPVTLTIFDVETFNKLLDNAIAVGNKTNHQTIFTLNGVVSMSAHDLDFSKEMSTEIPGATYINRTDPPQETPLSTASPNEVKAIEQRNADIKIGYEPPPMSISFNGKFLKDITKTLAAPLSVEMSTPSRAAIWHGANKKEFVLLMPIMINV